jgi:predicted ester cyclase
VNGVDVARRFVDLWYAEDSTDELRSIVTPGYVHHAPGADLTFDEFAGQLELIRGSLTDPEWRVLHAVEDGDLVAVYVTFAGTHSGDFFGIAATGRRVTTAGACFMRLEDGRIAEDWDVWGLQSILFQLRG